MSASPSRRTFLVWLARFLSITVIGVFFFSIFQRKEKSSSVVEKISPPKANGVALYKKVVLIKEGNSFRAFSRKCTHLGCDLTLDNDGKIVCPCHGSRFDLDGAPLYGPAKTPLTVLDVRKEPESGLLILERHI